MFRILVITLFFLCFSHFAYAHGEDKPGPRGGIIRMPGSFHTEFIKDGSTLKIYLLDFNFEDPITENSSVSGEVVEGDVVDSLLCTPEEDFFRCSAKNLDINKATEIRITSTRDNKPGVVVTYSHFHH